LLSYSLFCFSAPTLSITGPLTGPFPVQRVYDGDTIRAGGQKIRLVMIDAPESKENKRAADRNELEPGRRAKAFAEGLIQRAGRKAFLEIVPRPSDRYGRTLAWVYLPYLKGTVPWLYRGKQYTSLNYELVRQGWTEVFVVGWENTRYLSAYRDAQNRAKRLSLGMWHSTSSSRSRPKRSPCGSNAWSITLQARTPDARKSGSRSGVR